MAYYLDLLPIPKPGGRPNVLADWDGLTQETQLLILDELRQDPGAGRTYRRVLRKAVDGPYPYVTYVAAEDLRCLACGSPAAEGTPPRGKAGRHRH